MPNAPEPPVAAGGPPADSTTRLATAARAWLAHDPDADSRAAIAAMLDQQDHEALARAFAGRVAFGTAGLRARVMPGPLGINALVVRQSVAGLLAVVRARTAPPWRIGLAFDGRLDSKAFAREALGVIVAAGMAAEICTRPVPTPLLGFWVKEQNLSAGVVITASHNPKADNGIKMYWQGGMQIAAPIDREIAAAIDRVAAGPEPVPFAAPPLLNSPAAGAPPRPAAAPLPPPGADSPSGETAPPATVDVTDQAKQAYLAKLFASPIGAQPTAARVPIRLAYSALHGVGQELTEAVCQRLPFVTLLPVAAQAVPDGHFPTVASPNPEARASLSLALAEGVRQRADLVCVHDPDADRLAVAAPRPSAGPAAKGPLVPLTGDDLGLALAYAGLKAKQPDGRTAVVVSSLVSSQLPAQLAAQLGATHIATLPGFKWLARAAKRASESTTERCVLAYEEALGYAVTELVWDKDGVATLWLVAQLAERAKALGQTLWQLVAEAQACTALGATGQETVPMAAADSARLMAALRGGRIALPSPVPGYTLAVSEDGLSPAAPPHLAGNWLAQWFQPHNASASDGAALSQPAPDVDASSVRVLIRPSGTEPKVKVYYEWLRPKVPAGSFASARTALDADLALAMQAHRAALLAAVAAQARQTGVV